jgi:hypothetical protein
MASANFDILHLRFSRMIDDPVATATTDGDQFTSARRSAWLTQGIRSWVDNALSSGDLTPIRGYINVESKAMVASVLTLSASSGWAGGVHRILSAIDTTPTPDVVVRRMPNELYDYALLGANKYLIPSATNCYYTEENGTFKLYGGGATDTIQLTYVKLIPEYTANYASDIAIDTSWYDDVLNFAYATFVKEYPSKDNTARIMVRQ